MVKILVALLLGALVGAFIKLNNKWKKINGRFQQLGLIFLLFSMGASIGADEGIIRNLPVIGFKSFLFAALTILFSIILVYFFSERFILNTRRVKKGSCERLITKLEPQEEEVELKITEVKEEKKDNTMTYIILGSVITGIACGFLVFPPSMMKGMDLVASISLVALIFSVGIDIGGNREIFKELKRLGFKVLFIPLAGIVGSIIGSIIVGLIFNIAMNESLAIGAGYGWYSLSGVLLKEIAGETIGAIAFLTNVFRELFAVILIPILAKKLNDYTAIAPAGAASMDTLLPLVSKATNPEVVIVSFINGVILSTLVPILVPFFYNL